MADMVLLGDEAVAMGAVHAGLSAAYAYPGTPSTEIVEYLIRHKAKKGRPLATWATNEKTAYEAALGVSMAGRRSLVAMKHVGLNVAADPFMNSAIVSIHGGLVAVVADDPGMHSSQNEQDSRYFADFARVICLEPANQQEAYAMTREAFDLSERFHIPVLVRLVTRLAHSRAVVRTGDARPENPLSKSKMPQAWILLPANARRQWHSLLERQQEFLALQRVVPAQHARAEPGTPGAGRHHDRHRPELLRRESRGPGLRALAPPYRRVSRSGRQGAIARRSRAVRAHPRGGLPVRRTHAARHRASGGAGSGQGVGRGAARR